MARDVSYLLKYNIGKKRYIDMVGQRFGRLFVSEISGYRERSKSREPYWKCNCDCGGYAITSRHNLIRGRAKSCGCWHSEEITIRQTKERIIVDNKICPACSVLKASSDFGKDSSRTDGLTSQCKFCKNVEYKRKNMGKTIANTALRKRSIQKAAPSWVDKIALEKFYIDCQEISKTTGVKHHVDHIVPILGKNVRGLHVPWNLQIIPAVENLQKSNRLP